MITIVWAGATFRFSEIMGLDSKDNTTPSGNLPAEDFNKIKMPGLRKFTNITMKRGTFTSESGFNEWLNEITKPEQRKNKIVIQWLNENHEVVKTWVAKNAFPVKIQAPDLNARSNEVAIESIEIAHEGLRAKHKRP